MEVSSNADEIYERSRGNFYLKANRHLLHFILPWLVGMVWWGLARWCGESGLIFPSFFLLPVSPPASQSDCENISLTEAAREQRDGCKQPPRFMTAANKAEPQLFLSPVIFVLHLNSLYSTSSPLPPKKACHTSVGKLKREHKWFTGWLRGAHDALWALQERRSICSAGRASWQRGAVGWHRSQPL